MKKQLTALLIILSVSWLATLSGASAAEYDERGGSRGDNHSQLIEEAVRNYAQFWNSGDEALARKALSHNFIDRTLPEGRQQGVSGAIEASRHFREAVPDLTAQIEQMLIAEDKAAVRLRFKGHFSGQFGKVKGRGQEIDFTAVDIYRISKGKITDNWHLEDYLTLFTQMEVVSMPE